MAKKRKSSGGSDYNWMDTYGDMVTLLLTFFVMLFSMSSVNEEKFEVLIKAFSTKGDETTQIVLVDDGDGDQMANMTGEGALSGDGIDTSTSLPDDLNELYKYIAAYVEENDMQSSVTVSKNGENRVYVRFEDNIFFQPDSSVLIPDSTGILNFVGDCLKNVEDEIYFIQVNGHTADPKIENYNISDRVLSTNRANSVLEFFENTKNIEPRKMMASGYGKHYPIADNDTPEGRKKNRRVELMILGNGFDEYSQEELIELLESTINADLFGDTIGFELEDGTEISPTLPEDGIPIPPIDIPELLS